MGLGQCVAAIHREFPGYGWLDTDIRFGAEDELGRFVHRIAMSLGKATSTAVPYTEATPQDRPMLAATFGSETFIRGSSFDVKKNFPENPSTAPKLIMHDSPSPLLAAYYWLLMEAKGFTSIIGGTDSGKLTTLNVLLQLINPSLKIATIGETLGLNIPHEHWVRLRTR